MIKRWMAGAGMVVTLLSTSALATGSIEPNLLIGTWHCSFEVNDQQLSLVGTSVDQYLANGTARSNSHLSVQMHTLNLDVVYELGLETTWQVVAPDQLVETVVAMPTFTTSNPALEQILDLKSGLLNGKNEAAKIVELSQNRAVFRTQSTDGPQHDIHCTR